MLFYLFTVKKTRFSSFTCLFILYIFSSLRRCCAAAEIGAAFAEQANLRDNHYDATLLHWAVNEGHVPTVEHLLACGADVRLRDGKQ